MPSNLEEMELIRKFFSKRPFLRNKGPRLLNDSEYMGVMERSLILASGDRAYLLAFIDGWTMAKQ